jgi:hypothetical protein
LKQEIKNVEILYNKALYKECEKFVSRAKQVAREHEKFYYWYELISWEKKLLEEAYESGEFSTNLDELIAEITQAVTSGEIMEMSNELTDEDFAELPEEVQLQLLQSLNVEFDDVEDEIINTKRRLQ